MEKLKKVLTYSFYTAFSAVFILILMNSVFFHKESSKFKVHFLILGVIICMSLLVIIYRKFINLKKFNYKLFIGIQFGTVIILQIVFAYIFCVNPSWDFGVVYDNAVSSANGQGLLCDEWYFYRYPNNYPIALLLKIIYKIANLIHIDNYIGVGIAINIFAIDITIFAVTLIVKELCGEKKSCFVLALFSLVTAIYTYTPIFYTDTLSMPFTVLPIYLYLLANKQKDEKLQKLYYFLIGFCIYLGALIKFTVMIILIAIVIARLLLKKFRENVKPLGIVIGTIMFFAIIQNIITNYLFYPKMLDRESFPLTHWIMMGLSYRGEYNEDDVSYTAQFMTRSEKVEANKEAIKEKLKSYIEEKELLKFITEKLYFTWGDGTYYAPEKLRREPLKKGELHEYILYSGTKNKPYLYFSQIIYISYMIFMILAVFGLYHSRKNVEIKMILSLSMFGLMIFLLIWEARSRYLVNFIPYLVLLAYFGLEYLNTVLFNNCKKIKI